MAHIPVGEARFEAWGEYVNDPLREESIHALVPRLRGFLQDLLPEHMVPSAFVLLESLPLTSNGKVNHRALPAPEESSAVRQPFVSPRDEMEDAIALVWREVLHLEHVGINDNFFDLGGHSLTLMRAHARLQEVVKPRELSVVELFEHPTVASLAAHLRPGAERPARLDAEERSRRMEEGRHRLGRRLERRQAPGSEQSPNRPPTTSESR